LLIYAFSYSEQIQKYIIKGVRLQAEVAGVNKTDSISALKMLTLQGEHRHQNNNCDISQKRPIVGLAEN
jgi:hypothetical protein